MARLRRLDYRGAIHHVMNRGVDHRPIFFGDTDRIRFGQLLADIHDGFGVETLAYCLMGNHYHLLLRTPGGRISEAMQRLGGLYTRHTNDRVGRDGPIFRGRFHSKSVTTDSYLTWLVRYIHRNPLDIEGVRSPSSYRWSSYRAYLGQRAPATFMNVDLALGLFGHDRAALAAFTETDVGAADPLSDTVVEDLVQLVDFTISCHTLESVERVANPSRHRRTLLVLLSEDPRYDHVRSQLDRFLGFPNPDARRKALARARQRVASDAVVTHLFTTLIEHIRSTGNAARPVGV